MLCHARAILDSFKLKMLEKIKTEEPQETICCTSKIKKTKKQELESQSLFQTNY